MGMEITTWWVPPTWGTGQGMLLPGPHDGTTMRVKRRWGDAAVGEGEMDRDHCRRGGAPSVWDAHATGRCKGGALLPRPPPERHGEGESRSDPPAEGKGRCG